MPVLAAFHLGPVLLVFVWAVLVVMSFWAWKHGKTAASLMTFVGAVLLVFSSFCEGFDISGTDSAWVFIPFLGGILVVTGYYLTVKPIVDQRVRDLQAKRLASAEAGAPPRPPSGL